MCEEKLFPEKIKTGTKTKTEIKKKKTDQNKLSDESSHAECLYCGESYLQSVEGWV